MTEAGRPVGPEQRIGVICSLSEGDALRSEPSGLLETAHFSEAFHQMTPCENRWKYRDTEMVVGELSRKRGYDAAEDIDRPREVAELQMGTADVHLGDDAESQVTQLLGDGPGVSTRLDSALVLPEEQQAIDLEGQRSAEAAAIAQALGDDSRVAQVLEGAIMLAQQGQGVAKPQVHVNRLRHRAGRLLQALEYLQGLLKPGHRVPVGGAAEGLRSRLLQIEGRAIPQFALKRVMGQALDVLTASVFGIETLGRIHDPAVQHPAAFAQ